jgi:dTDP-4-amino-4,6-dideoxygalactose transaminase
MNEAVNQFEKEIAKFYNAPYAVAVDCCTHGIELCLRHTKANDITIPARTYLSVPMTAEKLGLRWSWKDEDWKDFYQIGNTNIIDAAVLWKENSYIKNTFMCLSFQFQKHLSLGRGGMILTDDKNAALILKKMSYDGRIPNVPWREQNVDTFGYHYYMTPETAQLGLNKLSDAVSNKPREWSLLDWPDLREMEIFK